MKIIKPDKTFNNLSGLTDEDFYKLVFIVKEITAQELNIQEDEIKPDYKLSLNDRRRIIDRVCKTLNISYTEEEIKKITNVAKMANQLGQCAIQKKLSERLDTILKARNIEFDFSNVNMEFYDKCFEFLLKCHATAFLSIPIFIQFQWYILLKFSILALGLTILLEILIFLGVCENIKRSYGFRLFAIIFWLLINYGAFWVWDKIWDLDKYCKLVFS